MAPLNTVGSGDLDGSAADHHRPRGDHVAQHAYARSIQTADTPRWVAARGAGREAARCPGGGARLEMAVLLSGTGHRHGERTRGAGERADRVQDHFRVRDELL